MRLFFPVLALFLAAHGSVSDVLLSSTYPAVEELAAAPWPGLMCEADTLDSAKSIKAYFLCSSTVPCYSREGYDKN